MTHEESYFETAYQNYSAQNPVRKLDHYIKSIERFMGDKPVTLLDIGCGKGAFLQHVEGERPHWSTSGTDIEDAGLMASAELAPNSTILKAAATDTPFPDSSFDVITCWDVLEHVQELEDVAVSIQQMLKPGGFFLFVVPVYDGVAGPIIQTLDKDPTHIHKKPRAFWLDWVSESFQVLDWHGIVRYLMTTSFYIHIPTGRLRRHAPAILVASTNKPL